MWAEHAISNILPAPSSDSGSFQKEDSEKTEVIISNITSDDFAKYVDLCKNKGFNIDEETKSDSFAAYNGDGYYLKLSFTAGSRTMNIELESPMKFSTISLPNVGIAAILPTPPSSSGKIGNDYDWTYSAYFNNMTYSDYEAYVQEVINAGFDKNIRNYTDEHNFWAEYSNDDDISVNVEYTGNNIVYIHISGSLNGDYSGYKRTGGTTPSSTSQAATTSATETTVVEETTTTVTETTIDSSSQSDSEIREAVKNGDYSLVTPEFKATMDAYEAFYDEYLAFMKKYTSGEGDVLSMLTDYTNMMSKLDEWSEKIDKIDESTLSPADDAYYLLVTLRVSQKMIGAIY